MQTGRREQAGSTLKAVRERHQVLEEIQQGIVDIAQMFQDLDNTVAEQDVAIVNIEQQGEQVEENVAKANVQIDGAIVSAKAARKKKFWCLGIASKFHCASQECAINLLLQYSSLLSSLSSLPLL